MGNAPCGEVEYRPPWVANGGVEGSKAGSEVALNVLEAVSCPVCDAEFVRAVGHTGQVCCSRACDDSLPVRKQCVRCHEAFNAPGRKKVVELCPDCASDGGKGKEVEGGNPRPKRNRRSTAASGTRMDRVRREERTIVIP